MLAGLCENEYIIQERYMSLHASQNFASSSLKFAAIRNIP